jgi:hypothetical protein
MNHLAGLSLMDEQGLWQVGRDNPLEMIGTKLEPDQSKPVVVYQDEQFKLVY